MSVNIDYTGSNGPAFLEGIEAPRIDETTTGGGTYMVRDVLIYGASGPRVKHVSGAIHMRNNADDDFVDMRASSLILDGDLIVNGTQTIINTTTLSVEDSVIEVARNQVDPPTLDAGLIVQRGGVVPNAQLLWDESAGYWTHGVVGTMKRVGDLVDPTTTQGDLIVRGAAAIERLGIGTAGQVLTVNGTATGYVFSTPSGTIPNGALAYQHLEWSGTAWEAQADFTLPGGSYGVSMQSAVDASAYVLGMKGASSTGAGNVGGTLTLTGGENTNVAGGNGGVLNLYGGQGLFGGSHGGEARLKGGNASTGNGGSVVVSGGDSGTTGDGGNVFIYGGRSIYGSKGVVEFYNSIDAEYADVSFTTSDAGIGNGTRIISDLVFRDSGDGQVTITAESKSSGDGGTNIRLFAGQAGSEADGGNLELQATWGGDSLGALPGGSGGGITMWAGFGGDGSGTQAPGDGGWVNLISGAGGNATATGTGGNGGTFSIIAGAGGSSPQNGGNGGDVQVIAGSGGSGVTGGAGGSATLQGGDSTGDGGDVFIIGGETVDGAGGDVFIRAGNATGIGSFGSVIIGNQYTSEVQIGGASSVDYQLQGNTGNRLVTGADGNTIVMRAGTSHRISIDQAASGNGDILRIGAGAGAGASDNGGDLYLEAGDGGASALDGTVHLASQYGHDIHAGAPIQQYLGGSDTYVHHFIIYSGSTSAANTWTEVYQTGARRFEMVDQQVVVADIIVSARVNNVVAAFKYKAIITRDNGAASVVIENAIKETLFNDIGVNTDFRVTADTTNGTFKVEVKSDTATQTNWTVGVRATSTIGA